MAHRCLRRECMTLRTLNYGNYGIFLIMGNAGFISSILVPFCDFLYSGSYNYNPQKGATMKPMGFRV